ncbi:DNA-directed RNA polymerase specialized sigma24 family protein [Catenulispora sp. GAS73]|uniref:RNA polymerase sigma factor n=1 Tax=Catenulispora sp. GAS73 TaxID=3156269 RepID=UPI003513CCE1
MIEQSDTAVLAAARIGDPDSQAELVERCLPVVYNIVGRALPRRADVDDIVRDAMLQVLRALPGVRDPRSLRLLLVAEALEQVRRYPQPRHAGSARRDDSSDRGGAAVAFDGLDASRLGLSGEQRELVRAAAWSDVEDRELLSLWWLAESGHLARAELVDALELASHQAAVRVARLKEQLDAARLVERALTASRGCAILFASASAWDGRPDQRWRVHLAGHIRTCTACRGAAGYVAPAEQVFDGLAMVAPPIGLAGRIVAGAHDGRSGSSARTARPSAGGHRATGKRTRHRAGGLLAGSLAGETVLTAVAGAALLTGYTVLPDAAAPSEAGHKPLAAESFTANQHPGSPPAVLGTPIRADPTTDTAPTGSAPPHNPATSAPTGAAKPASSSDAKPPTSASTSVTTSSAHPTVAPSSQSPTTTSAPSTSPDPSQQGPVAQVLAEINQARPRRACRRTP